MQLLRVDVWVLLEGNLPVVHDGLLVVPDELADVF